MKTRSMFTGLATAALITSSAQAAVIVEETFDYGVTDGTSVAGLDGGVGWAEPWGDPESNSEDHDPNLARHEIHDNQAIFHGGGDGQQQIMHRRHFSSPISITQGTTYTLTFDFILNETQPGRGNGIALLNNGEVELFVGKAINSPTSLHDALSGGIFDADNDRFSSNNVPRLQLDMTYDGSETTFVLSSPLTLETLDPMTREGQFTFDGLALNAYHQATNSNGVDNISIVPEPGSLALLSIGGLMLMRRRRA